MKNRVDELTEKAVVNIATDRLAYGQVRVSNELRKERVFVSPAGVRSICLRHNLETFKKRIKALEKELQSYLDLWLVEYSERRTHQGKMCCGRTPMKTFLDGKQEVRQKMIGQNLN